MVINNKDLFERKDMFIQSDFNEEFLRPEGDSFLTVVKGSLVFLGALAAGLSAWLLFVGGLNAWLLG